MRFRFVLLALLLPACLRAQETRSFSARNGTLAGIFELHQITPGSGIRDANSRGGWGGQLGFEIAEGRFVVEAGGFPTQFNTSDQASGANEVLTLGLGFDYLFPLAEHRDGGVYLLAGLHLDSWTGRAESETGHESNSASHLGLRMGAGLRLGPIFGEIRYRVTEGDIRVSSSYPGRGGAWGAVEVGMGVRF